MKLNMITSTFLIALLSLFASPVLAQGWSSSQVISFLEESLPRIEGTVVSKSENSIYVEMETPRNLQNYPVDVYRREVVINNQGKQSIREQNIGSGKLSRSSEQPAILSVSNSLRSQIRTGDRVRNRRYTLFVNDRTESWSPRWSQAVESLNHIKSVFTRSPENQSGPSLMQLIITEKELQLKRVGEWGTLASRQRSTGSTGQESKNTSDEPSLKRVNTIDRIIRDAAFIELPDHPQIKLIQLGSENEIGFALLRKGKVRRLRWHEISGEVISITPLPRQMENLSAFPFLVVTRLSGSIMTRYYEYDLTGREMVRKWSARNVWIEDVNDRLYGWRIGLNEPFKNPGYPVHVSRDSWDWRKNESPKIPPVSIPTAVQRVNNLTFRMNKDGNIDVFRNGTRSHSSTQVYGGHPVSIQARRSRIQMDRHPSFVAWQTPGQIRIVAGNNQPQGVPYFKGLQSYESSRLYLLSAQSRFIDTIWESDRLGGYIAGIYSMGNQIWVVTVNPNEGFSVLQRLNRVNYQAP